MEKRIKYNILLLLILFFVVPMQAQQKRKEKGRSEFSDGTTDRKIWVDALYKIAFPVIHNLAEGTLSKNMPVETSPDYGLDAKKVTYLEAVGRTLAGIAPWLELPDDDTEEGILRKRIREKAVKGLVNAVDPLNPDYLNFRVHQQPIVDAAYVVHAFLRAPKALWEPLNETTKQRFVEEFKSLRNRTGAYNNWLLFAGITEAFLMKIGEEYDPARINMAVYKLREWYVGDGWYSDGGKFSMDYYNDYVMHPMLVDMLKVLVDAGKMNVNEYDKALKRMIRHAEFSERLIAPDGSYPPFGRSITYRTAAFQSLCQVALMDKLPAHILPAQVRCGLTRVIYNMYDGNQNFDAGGWLVLGFNGHQPEIADVYTSTGSLYMATLGFLPLGLPANHPFWTDAPVEWSALKAWKGEKVKRDYKVEY
ncbi:DUF2264 domain-containing protein [Bacteroides pyogenes]|nr:DUF2264 domain-containing protein [Bacteroides pyogenes]MBR8709355.1 hypothetical protein [Bacteroides pyogenes]MBR8718178.1 hypothetical protein [Bacteroides pyogenes]MBR8747657.1 hypothetical protein [Bacteroides pyogenes]MBR8758024.1 hypothetical protein [Bacteroides pyogenes]MBR8781228.1 hypothetical protein [Bacteroides pyogenes]